MSRSKQLYVLTNGLFSILQTFSLELKSDYKGKHQGIAGSSIIILKYSTLEIILSVTEKPENFSLQK